MYIPVKGKLIISHLMAVIWVAFSIYVALPWIEDLAMTFAAPLAWFMVVGVALIPGWANAFLSAGLVLDRRPDYAVHGSLPPVTILIAAFNEEENVGETLASMTLLLLPLMLLVNILMFYNQVRIFLLYGLRVRKNVLGAILIHADLPDDHLSGQLSRLSLRIYEFQDILENEMKRGTFGARDLTMHMLSSQILTDSLPGPLVFSSVVWSNF